MIKLEEVVVIVPVYNEHIDVLKQVIDEILDKGYFLILVNDGSQSSIKNLEGDRTTVIEHKVNRGQGAALRTGMQEALKRKFKYAVHMDGDGQHDPDHVSILTSRLIETNSDIALGTRFATGASFEGSILRKTLLKSGCILNYLLCGLWLSDSNNGFRMLNQKAMESIILKSSRMAHASEIVWLIKWKKLRYVEVPTHIRYTQYSLQKGQSLWNSIPVLVEIIKTYLAYSKQEKIGQ